MEPSHVLCLYRYMGRWFFYRLFIVTPTLMAGGPMKNILLIIMLSISPLAFADNEVKTPPAQVIEIDIKGMACPFCQDGLSRKLNELPVVQQVDVSLKNKKARIIVKPGQSLDEELLRQTIIDSGFTPGELRVNK